ncbi:MAG: hypothetical protein AAFZ07_28335 [Actinomycetota bacterium]
MLWPQVLRQLHWWVRAGAVVTIVAAIAGLLSVVGYSPGESLVGALIVTGSLWVALGVVGFVVESRPASADGGPLRQAPDSGSLVALARAPGDQSSTPGAGGSLSLTAVTLRSWTGPTVGCPLRSG